MKGCCEYQYRPRSGQYTKWTLAASDCSAADSGLANEALLYLQAKVSPAVHRDQRKVERF